MTDCPSGPTAFALASTHSISPRADFCGAWRAEWTKLTSVRSTVWLLGLMAAVLVGIAVLVGATESLQPDDTILGGSLTGASTAAIVAGILGVLAISSEYGNGTIRTTFMALPRRGTVLAAKAVVVAGPVLAVALFASTAAYLVANALLPEGVYASGEPMPALVGIALAFSATSVLGLAAGTILRHSAGAITVVIAILLIPVLIGPLFGDLERWITGAIPGAALQKLAQSSDAVPEAIGSVGPWPSLLIVCAYSATSLVVAALVLKRRDA